MRGWILLAALMATNLYGAEVYEFRVKPKPEPVVIEEPVIVEKPSFEKAIVRRAKEAVIERLIYAPDRVEFRNVRSVYGQGGLEFVCGEFNALSDSGEPIGFVHFTFRANRMVISAEEEVVSDYSDDALSGFTLSSDGQSLLLDCD